MNEIRVFFVRNTALSMQLSAGIDVVCSVDTEDINLFKHDTL